MRGSGRGEEGGGRTMIQACAAISSLNRIVIIPSSSFCKFHKLNLSNQRKRNVHRKE